MAEHKHGKMDIEDHERTFEGFVKAAGWSVVLILLFLVFLALFNA